MRDKEINICCRFLYENDLDAPSSSPIYNKHVDIHWLTRSLTPKDNLWNGNNDNDEKEKLHQTKHN